MEVAALEGVVEKVERFGMGLSSSPPRFVVYVRTSYLVPLHPHYLVVPYLPDSANPSVYKMGDYIVEIWVNAKDELDAYLLCNKAIQKWIDHGAEPQRK